MLLEHESHVEYRGSKANFISFEISVLEKGKKEEDLYLHVLVSVTDPERKSYTRGSSNTPLTTSFLFYENGEHDMPLEREIHEREY